MAASSSDTVSTNHPQASRPLGRSQAARIRHAIQHAAHLLPSQGPISVFVHHNTLHAFEDLPFEQAVVAGGKLYECEPFLAEEQYRQHLDHGRIRVSDLEAALLDDLDESASTLVATFGTRYALRLAMLQYPLRMAPDSELQWLVAETDAQDRFRPEVEPKLRERTIEETRQWVLHDLRTNGKQTEQHAQQVLQAILAERGSRHIEKWSNKTWESFVLRFLWQVCNDGVRAANKGKVRGERVPSEPQRLSTLLLDNTGFDADRLVDDVLIRYCSAFLDQGFADWELPQRERGFYLAFAHLYANRTTVEPRWMRGLRAEMQQVLAFGTSPLQSIEHSLNCLATPQLDADDFVLKSLLALRGWAGLIWQMETNAPWTPQPAPAGTLEGYLAVRLTLERYALAYAGQCVLPPQAAVAAGIPHPSSAPQPQLQAPAGAPASQAQYIDALRNWLVSKPQQPAKLSHAQQAFVIYQLAQVRGWSAKDLVHLTPPQWRQLLVEVESFSSVERRRIFHVAFERKYRHEALDALVHHASRTRPPRCTPPAYQVICCIDDREESFRRHLEECDPDCETFGAAGFFAVAMYYQGAADAHYRPLCPVVITPEHYVREEPVFSATDVSERRTQRRRLVGQMTHQFHARSKTLLGGAITGLLGSLATFPLVARILAPRLTAQMRSTFGSFVRPPATELHVERVAAEPGPEFDNLGYSLDEMAGIVTRILQDIGLLDNWSPIILFVGHGSSSLNNPHESAYNCGACSGGRGGPNARAFSMMANDPRVRGKLAKQGIEIPNEVRFIGAYHNTCDDRVEYYDLDQLPRSHRPLFLRMEKSINEARARNAHERARRFESASLDLTPAEALQHVEERSEDLSQARPEYNHATNAWCLVGRRAWSRGLFLDRRAFLTSYNPAIDDAEASILARVLAAAIPVCAGINLEYLFSTVDNEGYGCGSKLPHNIASLAGVMTGAASDMRPGLSAQMVEIHEPIRILFVIETTPEKMQRIMDQHPAIGRLVRNRWVQLAVYDAATTALQTYRDGRFVPYQVESLTLPQAKFSQDWYGGRREHLPFCSIMGDDVANDQTDDLGGVPASQERDA